MLDILWEKFLFAVSIVSEKALIPLTSQNDNPKASKFTAGELEKC